MLSTTATDQAVHHEPAGAWMHALATRLFPLNRSITGDGLRATLEILREFIPLERHEIPSGTPVLDWVIPHEWNLREAWIKDPQGRKVADFAQCNLHVVNYSRPVQARLSLAQLQPHLHTHPEHPDWIPYRTSYYQEDWGFCLSRRQWETLREGTYEVYIDASLKPGHLSYGELLLRGERDEEFLITSHCCHPSLANDNLSGIVLAARLARWLGSRPRRFSYRFLFAPGTIGAIAWLAGHREELARIKGGLVLACVGDGAPLTYQRTRQGDATIDRAATLTLEQTGTPYRIQDFTPLGFDERQYNSPGFALPIGRLSRSNHGEYPEYHTSADNLSLIRPEALQGAAEFCQSLMTLWDGNGLYRNRSPYGEPQLGRRGLYHAMGGLRQQAATEQAMLWVLNLGDGRHDLLEIARRARLPFEAVRRAADLLLDHDLLEPILTVREGIEYDRTRDLDDSSR